jgi:hypothetical protein
MATVEEVPDQDVSHQPGLRLPVTRDFVRRCQTPVSSCRTTSRHASMRSGHGSRDARAERRSERVPWKEPKERIPWRSQIRSFLGHARSRLAVALRSARRGRLGNTRKLGGKGRRLRGVSAGHLHVLSFWRATNVATPEPSSGSPGCQTAPPSGPRHHA